MDTNSVWRAAPALGVALLAGLIAVQAAQAQAFSTLHSFNGADGSAPEAALIQGSDGNLHGTTYEGGSKGFGTVFKITATGTLTTTYDFCLQAGCPDGDLPMSGLVQANNGVYYGTTSDGGSGVLGTVFSITAGGKLTTLHNFNGTDGSIPAAGLIQASNGILYGTTFAGGGADLGTVFKITTAGTLTTLDSFCLQTGCPDGSEPSAGLTQATDAQLYGTTTGMPSGNGTVFKITAAGKPTTLHNFNGSDGGNPNAGLIQANDGNLYGTTSEFGTKSGGTVFKITPSGTLTTIYNFCTQAGCTDGKNPYGGLIQATDGDFYGTTEQGGGNTGVCANGCGTIFKITSSGTLTTLHSFDGTDGAEPRATLVQATNGSFYGTTSDLDLSAHFGTVFKLAMGLAPFVETPTTSGKVGAVVAILGNKLKGSTSVTFNGTAATFSVVSASEIKATVPTGATTGSIQVTTLGGTMLQSNKVFTITP